MEKMASPGRTGGKTTRIVAQPPYLSGGRAAAAPKARSATVSDELDALLFDPATSGLPADAPAPAAAATTTRRIPAIWQAMPVLVRVMFALDLLMGVLYIASRRLRDHIGRPLVNFFDLNGETNLPSWYSAAQLALIGALLIVFATSQLRRGARAAWSIMLGGIGFLFLSLDETTSIHENFGYWLDHLRNRRDTIFAQTGFWMLICAPLFLGGLALLGFGARRYLFGRGRVVVTLVVGAVVFVAAAAGVEMLSNFVEPHGIGARGLVMLEEVGEMIGATIMLWGVCGLMRAHGVRLLVTDDAPPSPPLSTRP
jgi:hypothetical protein